MSERLTLLNNLVAIVEPAPEEEPERRIIAPRGYVRRDLERGERAVYGELHRGRVAHLGPGARRVKIGWDVYYHVQGPCFSLQHGGVTYLVVEEAMVLARIEVDSFGDLEDLTALAERMSS
jgi:hypothetical protein